MIKTRHSSELASRRRSTALSSLRGTREGQAAGKEALAGLLDFLASPSPTSSADSLTPISVAEPQPTPQALPAVHNTPQISVAGSAINSGETQAPKKEKRENKKKKVEEKNECDKKSEGTPKKEKGSRSAGSAAKKGLKSPGEAERTLPDRLAMAAQLEKETLEWEKELRTPTRCSADKTKKEERRPSFTLRRRSSANLSSLVEQAPTTGTPQDAFFVEGSGSQAEQRVYNTARARTQKMSKQEARMTWSPELAAEMITQNNDVPPQPRKRSLWSRLSVRQPLTVAQTSSLELLVQEEEEQWEKENYRNKAVACGGSQASAHPESGTPFFVSSSSSPAVATRSPLIARSAYPSSTSSLSSSCSAASTYDQPLPSAPYQSPCTLPPPLPPRLPGYASAPHRPVSPTTTTVADYRSRRKSLALSNWQASRATQAIPGGQESLEGLLDFLDSPSSSPSATRQAAPPSPTPVTKAAASPPPPVAGSPPVGRGVSSEKAQRKERRKREKQEKKMEKERRKNEEKNKKLAQKGLPTKPSAEVHQAGGEQAGNFSPKPRGLFRKREARMTWSPQVAAETMSQSRGLLA